MYRGANANTVDRAKVVRYQGALHVEHRGERFFGPRERGTESVAHRLEDVAAVNRDRGAHELVVPPHRAIHSDAIAIPALRAPFDIRKGEGDRACWDAAVALLVWNGARAHERSFRYRTRPPVPLRRIDGTIAPPGYPMLRTYAPPESNSFATSM
jgi:hypothetical protein